MRTRSPQRGRVTAGERDGGACAEGSGLPEGAGLSEGAGLPELVGWLAIGLLALVVGSYGGQVVRGPPADLDVHSARAPERFARWIGLPPPGPPAPPSPAPAFDLVLPTPAPVAAAALTATPSPGGRAPLPVAPRRAVVARAVLTEVRFVPRRPAPVEARAASSAAAPAEDALIPTTVAAVSRLSPDTDADAWRRTRAALAEGRLPAPASVRVEDLVNAQASTVPPPPPGQAVAVDAEVAPHPWREGLHLLRVGLRAADDPGASPAAAPARQLTVLVDTSGSMGLDARLDQVQAGLHALVDQLGPGDRLSLLSFADAAEVRVVQARVGGDAAGDRARLRAEIDALRPDGASATAAALRRAGEEALRHYLPGADNRVVLITDGEANVGVGELAEVARGVELLAARGLALDVVAVEPGEGSAAPIAALAARGGGRYLAVAGFDAARRTLPRHLLRQPALAAGQHTVTLTFDPDAVAAWRLHGHDGAAPAAALPPVRLAPGQVVTALYELALQPAFLLAELDRALAEVHVDTLGEGGGVRSSVVVAVRRRQLRAGFDRASRDLRVSLAAAAFGALLRAPPRDLAAWQQVAALVGEERPEDRQLRRMVLQAGRLAARDGPAAAPESTPDALLLRRVQRASETLAPCLADGAPEGRLDLSLELDGGRVVGVAVAPPIADPTLRACVEATARGWRFPTTWSASLELPLALLRRDGEGGGG